MRGNGYGKVIGQNVAALSGQLHNEQRMNRKWKMCWKCQKDKPVFGGSLKMMGGYVPGALARFICKDCIEAKQAELKARAA